jgi:hypothetical protein
MIYEDEDYYQERQAFVNQWIGSLFFIPTQIERLKNEIALLANDQYAKAHLGEVLRLEDRINSVLMTWDETVNKLIKRIEALEAK